METKQNKTHYHEAKSLLYIIAKMRSSQMINQIKILRVKILKSNLDINVLPPITT